MSICVPLTALSDAQRNLVFSELALKIAAGNPIMAKRKGRPVPTYKLYPYRVTSHDIYLPFAWAQRHPQLSLMTPPRTAYPEMNVVCTATLREPQRRVKAQIVDTLRRQPVCIIALPCGFGKSVLALYMACKLRLPTLILVNRTTLVKQWMQMLETYCPDAHAICLLPGKYQELPEADMYVMNIANVPKLSGWERIGLVIADEMHLLVAKQAYISFLYLTPRYVLALSATPFRYDGLNQLIPLFFGEERIEEKIQRPHAVLKIETNIPMPSIQTLQGQLDWHAVLQAQSENMERNAFIVNLVHAFPERTFLILVKRLEQGFALLSAMQAQSISATHLLGNATEFDTEARVLIGTNSKIGTGFSHDRLDALIVAADLEAYYVQYLGRVFRRPDVTPYIFDLVDDHAVLQRHFTQRANVYHDIGGKLYFIDGMSVTDIQTMLR